ncbi:MAG: Amino acid-binding protein [Clostridia bacterium]|jgi:branched-chain amino acid transport system substrate-binding protein|nr:Amino acid-binding protein [Clostridia bacterium]
MKLKKLIAMVLSGMMALGLAGCGGKDSATVKIGLITPKTGQVAQYGIAVENAVNLAVEEVNAAGGIGGKKVELISYDNKADATESINIFNRLVDNDKIVALVGPVISSTSLAVAPLADEKKIPMITPTATNLAVTPDYPYVFRACYTDPYQGSTVAKFASENLKAKTAAVLYNAGDDYSTGLAEAFKATFEAAGGTITSYEGYTADDKDFKAVLTTIKEKQPEVLFNPDYYNTVGLIAGQVKEVGLETIMLGGDGWDDVQKDYAGVVEGYYFANHYATDDEDAVVQDFIKAYKDKYEGNTPNALGALGYDAAKIMMEAIEKAGSTDGEKILAALQATDRDGVTGHVTFDENGDPQKSVSMITIKDGALKLEAKVGQ